MSNEVTPIRKVPLAAPLTPLGAIVAVIAAGGLFGAGPAPTPFELQLPAGFATVEAPVDGPTRVASLPPVAGTTEGEILLQATEIEGEGALFVARVPAPLRISEDLRERVALRAPEAFRALWGVDYRLVSVQPVEMAGRECLEIQGRIEGDRGTRTVLTVFVPSEDAHFVVSGAVPSGPGEEAALAHLRAAFATFRAPPPRRRG
ncbi:MAG: hypothetical protein D6729_05105, partial [Deltaproteobacteria bacterium]